MGHSSKLVPSTRRPTATKASVRHIKDAACQCDCPIDQEESDLDTAMGPATSTAPFLGKALNAQPTPEVAFMAYQSGAPQLSNQARPRVA